jgi:hypothetical protein
MVGEIRTRLKEQEANESAKFVSGEEIGRQIISGEDRKTKSMIGFRINHGEWHADGGETPRSERAQSAAMDNLCGEAVEEPE